MQLIPRLNELFSSMSIIHIDVVIERPSQYLCTNSPTFEILSFGPKICILNNNIILHTYIFHSIFEGNMGTPVRNTFGNNTHC